MKIQRAHFRLQLSDVYCTQPFLLGWRLKNCIALWSVGCVASCPFAGLWLNLLNMIHFHLSSSRVLCRGERADRLLDEPPDMRWGQGKPASTSPCGVGKKEDVGWSRGWAQRDAEHTQLSAALGCLARLWGPQALQWKARSRTIVEWVSVPSE